MGWPAGLKLNGNLSRFLGTMFQWIISLWSLAAEEAVKHVRHLVLLLGIVALLLGASMATALLADVVRLGCLHIRFCYFLAARIYSWQFRVISSLFHLFRGKKWNVLRNRLDSAEYDLDQLLLGTILFASLVCLLPTVAVYYGLFALSRLTSLGLYAAISLASGLLSQLPLWRLLARRSRISGIRLELDEGGAAIKIKYNHPTSLGVLRPLAALVVARIRQVFNGRNIKSLLLGGPMIVLVGDDTNRNGLAESSEDSANLPSLDAISRAFDLIY